MENIGRDSFAVSLRRLVDSCCPIDSMIVTRYSENAPPVALYHDLDDVQAAISVQFYATGPYLLDPLYQASRKGHQPGIVRTLDLAPEAFFRSEYYRTFYRNIRISDEAGALIRFDERYWIVVSFALTRRRARFGPAQLARLQTMFPILATAVEMNWGDHNMEPRSADQKFVEDSFESFGADILSPREAEIIRLVLQGHSTPSAAAYLGISEGTVKVHRHNAYAKLGVSSQAELFSMATRHVISPT
nr:LuxR family transcriptional regulator [Defluviimonas salinarum]